MVKLLILSIAALIVMVPVSIDYGPTQQTRAEKLVSNFLAQHGPYIGMYFSDLDTAFTTLPDESSFRELSQKVLAYQDSTIMFSHIDVARSDFFYSMYKKLNLQRDSIRVHYKPRPLGYLLLHHFQYDEQPWTDSFVIDFNLRRILKIKETIE